MRLEVTGSGHRCSSGVPAEARSSSSSAAAAAAAVTDVAVAGNKGLP